MFRFLKYLSFGLVALLLTMIIIWRLCSQELATYAGAKIAKVAIASNVFLNFTDSSFGLFNFQSKLLTVEVANQKFTTNLEISDFKLSPVITSLVGASPAVHFTFNVLGGKVSGQAFIQQGSFGLKDLQVRNVAVSQLSFLKLFGFSTGQLSMDLEQSITSQNLPQIKNLRFELSNFVKKDASVVPSWMSGLPFNLNIEPINIEKLAGQIDQDNDLHVKDLNLLSDWGNLSAELQLNLDPRGIKILMASGNVELKDSGSKQFSPFLALVSNRQLTADQRRFNFAFLEYQAGMPKFNFK